MAFNGIQTIKEYPVVADRDQGGHQYGWRSSICFCLAPLRIALIPIMCLILSCRSNMKFLPIFVSSAVFEGKVLALGLSGKATKLAGLSLKLPFVCKWKVWLPKWPSLLCSCTFQSCLICRNQQSNCLMAHYHLLIAAGQMAAKDPHSKTGNPNLKLICYISR